MKKRYKFTYALAAIVAAMVLIFSSLAVSGVRHAYAATVTTSSYEQSNVLDDLKSSTIDGKPFSLEDFDFDKNKSTQLLAFIEFGYSYYSNMQHDYGLYIYVYNPQELTYITNSSLNKILLRCGGNESDKPEKYDLQFLNQSTAEGTEGLFYKFKIVLSDAEREAILNKVDSAERIYEVSEIELSDTRWMLTNAIAYPVAKKYRYSGYSENHGPLDMQDSTLSINVDGVEDVLELDVKHTVYRPQGDYYNGKQSQLNSCYFRVPEKYFSDYGELTNIGCEWYEYITQPILVTETDYLYKRLYELHGASVDNFTNNMYFLIAQVGNSDEVLGVKNPEILKISSNYKDFKNTYIFPFEEDGKSLTISGLDNVSRFNNFAAVFSATDYTNRYVSSEELTTELFANSEILGGSKINGKYSESLFSATVDAGHTRGKNTKEIGKDSLFDVFWNRTTKSVLQNWFGGYDVETEYESIYAIEEITEDKLKGTDSEISKRLYVSENDVADIKAELKKCKDERLVLFRFGSSDYYSIRCVESYCSKSVSNVGRELVRGLMRYLYEDNYTAYTFQETVYLDFDIIYLTYSMNNVDTIIPVIASPQDVISGGQPPLNEDYHNKNSGGCDGAATFSIIMIVVGTALAVILIARLIIWLKDKHNVSKKE